MQTPRSRLGAAAVAARVIAVPALLLVMGAWFVVRPGAQAGALHERRRLAPAPELSWASVRSGAFAEAAERYLGDHFPRRERWLDVASLLRSGVRLDDTVYYAAAVDPLEVDDGWVDDGPDVEAPAGGHAAPVGPAAPPLAPPDLAAADAEPREAADAAPEPEDPAARMQSGILLVGDRAMQLFRGGAAAGRAYADLLNGYVDQIPPGTRIYSLVVPTAVSFYLPEADAHRSRDERAALAALAERLDPAIVPVDAFPHLAAHADEPIYFRTDHHWTARGAYHAYRAFAQRAGFAPLSLDAFTRRRHPGFRGSLYGLTRDRALGRAPDVVEVFVPPGAYTAERTGWKDQRRRLPTRFVHPDRPGYGAFLGADYPLMVARTEARTGRRALLVKNSYGNPIAGFLLAHFEEVVVVDYRYFKGRLDALLATHRVTDLVLFNVSLTAFSARHRGRLRRLLGSPTPRPPRPPASVAADPVPCLSPRALWAGLPRFAGVVAGVGLTAGFALAAPVPATAPLSDLRAGPHGAALIYVSDAATRRLDALRAALETERPCPERMLGALADAAPASEEAAALPPLEDPERNLRRFHAALVALARGERRRVRIAVYGDSNHTMDWAAGALRTALGERFGYGGHGYVAAGRPWAWYQHREIAHRTGGGWRSNSATTGRASPPRYAHAGIVGTGTRRGAWVAFEPREAGAPANRVFDQIQVFYDCQPRGGRLAVEVDGEQIAEIDTACDASTLETKTLDVAEGARSVRLVTLRAPVRVYGVAFERDQPGVVVDGLGVGALNLLRLARSEEAPFVAGLEARDYDLVLFHTGSNMWSPKGHPTWAAEVLQRVRDGLGDDASILVFSPPDFARWRRGRPVSHPRMATCRDEKRAIARTHGVAFWDFFEAMGGLGSMAGWHARGLAAGDLVHMREGFHAELWRHVADRLTLSTGLAAVQQGLACGLPAPVEQVVWWGDPTADPAGVTTAVAVAKAPAAKAPAAPARVAAAPAERPAPAPAPAGQVASSGIGSPMARGGAAPAEAASPRAAGSPVAARATDAAPPGAAAAPAAERAPAGRAAAEALVARYRSALSAGAVAALGAVYAARLDRYRSRAQVSRSLALSWKRKALAQYRLEPSGPTTIRLDGRGRFVASFAATRVHRGTGAATPMRYTLWLGPAAGDEGLRVISETYASTR